MYIFFTVKWTFTKNLSMFLKNFENTNVKEGFFFIEVHVVLSFVSPYVIVLSFGFWVLIVPFVWLLGIYICYISVSNSKRNHMESNIIILWKGQCNWFVCLWNRNAQHTYIFIVNIRTPVFVVFRLSMVPEAPHWRYSSTRSDQDNWGVFVLRDVEVLSAE